MTEARPEQKKRPIRVLILWNHHDVAPQPVDNPDHPPAVNPAEGEPAEEEQAAQQETPDSVASASADAGAGEDASTRDNAEPDNAEPGEAEPGEAMEVDSSEPVLPRSAALAAEIEMLLEEQGFRVWGFDIEDDPTRIVDALTVARPQLVLNLAEHFYGDTTLHAHVAAYLDLHGVPYVGSDPLCLATCQDRVRTHLLIDNGGIPVPHFEVIRDVNVTPDTEEFRFPIIVTQAFDDIYEEEGVERPIADHDELLARSAVLFREFDLPYLVEEYIEARRLHAVVMGNRALEVLPLVEYDYSDEADPATPWILAQLDYETVDRVRQLARRAFRVMGCRDIAQIDFHLDDQNNPYVVDVRPMFDLGPGSVFRGAAEHTALGFAGVIEELTKLACRRAQIGVDEEEERSTAPEIVDLAPVHENAEQQEAGEAAQNNQDDSEAGNHEGDSDSEAEAGNDDDGDGDAEAGNDDEGEDWPDVDDEDWPDDDDEDWPDDDEDWPDDDEDWPDDDEDWPDDEEGSEDDKEGSDDEEESWSEADIHWILTGEIAGADDDAGEAAGKQTAGKQTAGEAAGEQTAGAAGEAPAGSDDGATSPKN